MLSSDSLWKYFLYSLISGHNLSGSESSPSVKNYKKYSYRKRCYSSIHNPNIFQSHGVLVQLGHKTSIHICMSILKVRIFYFQ